MLLAIPEASIKGTRTKRSNKIAKSVNPDRANPICNRFILANLATPTDKLGTAVAQWIELPTDYENGSGFESPKEYSQNMTERQEFTVLRTYKDFEIREYLPCVLAEVKVSQHYSSATSIAFGSLFKYISKGNQGAQKIAMTAPVIAAQKADQISENEWYVSFVMPSGSKIGHLPFPNDSNVILRELDKETCAAMSFRGRADEDLANKATRKLRAAAAKENISLSNETRICRFDPPFKPGFMHYNEIVIPALLGDI